MNYTFVTCRNARRADFSPAVSNPKGSAMRKLILTSLAAIALAGAPLALTAVAAPGDGSDDQHMRAMAEDHAFMFEAHLAGMKAALKLTSEQEKLWAPFESAVRDAAKGRMEAMRTRHEKMHEEMQKDERPSPIERMTEMSEHLAKASAVIKSIADAAKPLFDSLDETQKRHFGPLLMSLRESPMRGGRERREAGEMHGGGEPHEGGEME
jgi:hypothetical protein